MVAYLRKGLEAQSLLEIGFLQVGEETAFVSEFSRKPRIRQCYRCQRLGNIAADCNHSQLCARCASSDHHHSNCEASTPECTLCHGPHGTFQKKCQVRQDAALNPLL